MSLVGRLNQSIKLRLPYLDKFQIWRQDTKNSFLILYLSSLRLAVGDHFCLRL